MRRQMLVEETAHALDPLFRAAPEGLHISRVRDQPQLLWLACRRVEALAIIWLVGKLVVEIGDD